MTATSREFSISVRTASSYRQTLSDLRKALKRNGFEILCEFTLDRELERNGGALSALHGVRGLEPV
jgi:uncharacterized protein (DUF302 family)